MMPPAACLRPELSGRPGLWSGGFLLLGLIFVLLSAMPAPVHAAWDKRTIGDRDYVTLESFCRFYNFAYRDPGDNKSFESTNGRDKILLNVDSRIMDINGFRHWLAFGVIRDTDEDRYPDGNGPWLISKTDIVKLFEPILRPHMIKDRKPIEGVVLDPGHGGSDAGAVNGRGQREKQLALEMAFRIEKILKEKGVPVQMTRRSDTFVELSSRAARAGKYDNYLFVSLHFNSASSSAYGPETFVTTPVGASSSNGGSSVRRSDYQRQINNEEDARNILLGHELQTRLAQLYPGDDEADRGVKRARFVVLRKNPLPSALVEYGFLSNSREAKRIGSETYRQQLAEATANGILAFMRHMASPPETRFSSPTIRGPVINTTAPEVSPPPTAKPKPTPAPAPKPAPPMVTPPPPEVKPTPAADPEIIILE